MNASSLALLDAAALVAQCSQFDANVVAGQ